MNIIAFVLWIIALVVLAFVPEGNLGRGFVTRWSAFRISLFCFVLGWMCQLILTSHSVHQ